MKIAIAEANPLLVQRLRRLLEAQSDLSVIWTAETAEAVRSACRRAPPELLLMGLGLPGSSAARLTQRLMAETPCPILLLNSGSEPDYAQVFDALSQGAADAAFLPLMSDWERPACWEDLLDRLMTLQRLAGLGHKAAQAASPSPSDAAPPVLAIGASTGGPKALAALISQLPADFPATVVVVQHLDFHFTQGLAEWLNQSAALPVAPLTGDARLVPGQVWVAARPEHVIITDNLRLGWTTEWPALISRPSIDVFFKSLARHPSIGGCGVLLTGMGRDGAKGLLALRQAGFHTVAQDQASSVIYGMPKAAAELGAAEAILPLEMIAAHVIARMRRLAAATS